MINFSVSETTGRTFELEKEQLLQIAENNDIEIEDENDIAEIIRAVVYEGGLDDLQISYEKNNQYYEMNIEEIKEY